MPIGPSVCTSTGKSETQNPQVATDDGGSLSIHPSHQKTNRLERTSHHPVQEPPPPNLEVGQELPDLTSFQRQK